jgi:hypothetical protein
MAGWPTVSSPFKSTVPLIDESCQASSDAPAMFAAAGIHGAEVEPVGVVGLRIRPEEDFTQTLNIGRMGKTGDTYAFDKHGVLLSESRFDEQLKQIGLIPDRKSSRSVLAVDIRDPGLDLTAGVRAPAHRDQWPLTRMASDALGGRTGVDARGYRDVDVVGAWMWLPEYGIGVATEIEKAEVYQPIRVVQMAFATLIGLLALATVALIAFTVLAGRMEKNIQQVALAAQQLGQYSLETKIGEGGMGSVYRGRHAMLRRPTAIKLLDPAKTTQLGIARFEREVQLTSQLNHPNTIVIYDYGRTPEGVFYYAMEYLDGLSLDTLVKQFGPQPDARVIHILRQVCGSLAEAHRLGLIHRDVKPQNIMLTQCGGVFDFAKLLDFGVAKAISGPEQHNLTSAGLFVGTPLYMAPESIEQPENTNSLSDLYSLATVGYFLLTGVPVFDGGGMLEMMRQHLEAKPQLPSERLGKPISPQLEQLIMNCLAKAPKDRPASAEAMAEALRRCTPLQSWTVTDAARWWDKFEAVKACETSPDTLAATQVMPTAHSHKTELVLEQSA